MLSNLLSCRKVLRSKDTKCLCLRRAKQMLSSQVEFGGSREFKFVAGFYAESVHTSGILIEIFKIYLFKPNPLSGHLFAIIMRL